jgi:hypothetical protein
MAIAQRLVFVFEWKGAVHSNRRGCQLTQPLAGKVVVYGKLWPASPFPIAGLPTPFPRLPLVPPTLRIYVSSRSEWAIAVMSRMLKAWLPNANTGRGVRLLIEADSWDQHWSREQTFRDSRIVFKFKRMFRWIRVGTCSLINCVEIKLLKAFVVNGLLWSLSVGGFQTRRPRRWK